MSCDICNILKNKDIFHFIYEDDLCFCILHESPSYPGHCLVIPKEHVPIVEELDDKIVEHLFVVSNKVSTAIFESIGAHGTNIILNNGIDAGQELAHLVINVIPRKENDGINFEWPPKKVSTDDLKKLQSKIKVFSDAIFSGKDKLPTAKVKHEEHTASDDRGHSEARHDVAHGKDKGHAAKQEAHGAASHGTAGSHAKVHDSHGHDSHASDNPNHDSHGHHHEEKGEDYLTKNLIRPA